MYHCAGNGAYDWTWYGAQIATRYIYDTTSETADGPALEVKLPTVRPENFREEWSWFHKSLTILSTGGQLHGTWIAEEAVGVSDRRMKQNVEDLGPRLRRSLAGATGPLAALRPVAF
jgi:hypothetical protein